MFFVILFVCLLCYGLSEKFVPDNDLKRVVLIVSMVVATLVSLLFYSLLFLWGWPAAFNEGSLKKCVIVVAGPFIVFGVVNAIILNGSFGLATRLLGTDGVIVAQLTKERHRTIRSCKLGVYGDAELLGRQYLCIGEEQFRTIPKRGLYDVQIRRWKAGYLIDGIRLRHPDE